MSELELLVDEFFCVVLLIILRCVVVKISGAGTFYGLIDEDGQEKLYREYSISEGEIFWWRGAHGKGTGVPLRESGTGGPGCGGRHWCLGSPFLGRLPYTGIGSQVKLCYFLLIE